MTKDKRQLRAEAVERLRKYAVGGRFERFLLEDCPNYYMCDTYTYNKKVRDALIDLLTDDEPPEGDAWLMSEHRGEKGAGNDPETPDSAENPQEPPKKGDESTQTDTREELEADVRNYSDSGWLITVDKTFDWLDRQADITERECIARQNGKDPDYIRIVKELDAECAELQAKVDALEVENDEMARKLGTLLCTLTNGKFSHVEHPVEFMLSKVREEQEAELDEYVAELRAELDDLTERIERM